MSTTKPADRRTRAAAYFDLDKTVLATSTTFALGSPMRRSGLISTTALARGLVAQLPYLLMGADEDQTTRLMNQLAQLSAGLERSKLMELVREALTTSIESAVYSEALDLIERARAAVPTSVREAQSVLDEATDRVAQGQAEAERIVRRAQDEAEQLIASENVVRNATQRADLIVEAAEAQAAQLRAGADGSRTLVARGTGAASLRGIDMLLSEGMNIKVLLLPNGEDPDSFSRSHNAAEFRQFIAEREEDFIRFKTRLLLDEAENDPIKRAQLVANIAQSIGQIPNKIVRFTYTQECATLLHISEKIILEECEKYVKKRRQAFFNSSLEEKTSALPVDDAPPINVPTEECPPTPLSKAAKDAGDYQTYIPEIEREKLLFYTQEVELIKSIVRYGELPLYKIRSDDGQSRDLSVIEYIANDLKQDDLQFHHPLHRKIVAEGLAHLHDEGFTCERYFLTHPDQRISRIAAELISERYELSRRYEMNTEKDRLVHIIPQNLINFKLSIIEEEMKHTALLLSNPGPMKDGSRTKEIMLRYKELSTLMAKIAEKGGRVVI